MNFKIDENLPTEIADDLRALGHDAQTVYDQGAQGAKDTQLLALVQRERRVFLTMDKGIANVKQYPPDQYAGIILIRVHATGGQAVRDLLNRNWATILAMPLEGHLVVLSDSGIRIRG